MPYLTLDEIPSGRLCRPLSIPDDPLWLALFGGALTELTLAYNYQQFGTLTPQEMANACQMVIDEWYDAICGTCELPEGGALMRVGGNGVLQQQDNGEWTEPSGDYYIPPPEARTEPTPEERRCLAAANAANVLKQMYEEITDEYGAGLGALEAIAAFAVFVAGIIFPGVGLAVRALGLAALGIWQLAFDTAEFVTADFWTSAFDDNLLCALLRSASDDAGVVTFDWDKINSELINQIEWIDPTFGSFALAGQVRWMLAQIGVQGLNLAGATTGIGSADCSECIEPWCRREQFSVSDWGYTATNAPDWGGDLADYAPPWTEVANRTRTGVGDHATFLQIGKYLPPASYTKIEVDIVVSFGYSSVGPLSFGAAQIGGGSASVNTDGIHTLVIEGAWGGDDGFNIGAPIAYSIAGGVFPVGGNAEVTEVRYYGVGTPPDLGVEC